MTRVIGELVYGAWVLVAVLFGLILLFMVTSGLPLLALKLNGPLKEAYAFLALSYAFAWVVRWLCRGGISTPAR